MLSHHPQDGHPQPPEQSPAITRMDIYHPQDSHPPSLAWSSTIPWMVWMGTNHPKDGPKKKRNLTLVHVAFLIHEFHQCCLKFPFLSVYFHMKHNELITSKIHFTLERRRGPYNDQQFPPMWIPRRKTFFLLKSFSGFWSSQNYLFLSWNVNYL